MAFFRETKKPEEVKVMKQSDLKNEYNSLADHYQKIIHMDAIICPVCGRLKSIKERNFYSSVWTIHGYFPICRECVLREVQNIQQPTDTPKETKGSVQRMLRLMDRPYIESIYVGCVNTYNTSDKLENGRQRMTPFQDYMRQVCSLPHLRDKKWEDSEFVERGVIMPDKVDLVDEEQEIIKRGRKRFGAYSAEDLYQLESAYEDWVSRYPAEAKAQEVLFEQLCIQDLRARNLSKQGDDPKDAIKSCQEIMTSLGIKPSQNTTDAMTDQKSFGELIKAWEIEEPIPEPEGEWKDVDRIGLMIDVFFKGHLVKMLNIKNAFSSIYERFIGKYTVNRPDLSEDDETEEIFNKIFGEKMMQELENSE